MKKKNRFVFLLALALSLPIVTMMIAMTGSAKDAVPARPEGPCDIYAQGGSPCVAAHSSTRALYASYNGPLYQVMRQSDGKTMDIGVVKPSEGDPGGYANAAAQDAFCANTYCWVTILYDQSGHGNNLVQAPHGGFNGPAMGGFNNSPIADMAPITILGHKAYGIFIEPGMGLRLNDARGTAVDDQAEGQYWVINGHHFNNGCCYDYGNAETDSRDDGDGTMETAYYGNANYWYHGTGSGPWVMTDQENNLVGCVNPSPDDKYCPGLTSIPWRFVTAMADGEPHHWRSMGGDAQEGNLEVMYDGSRIINDRSSYDPMRKQGAILLGNGGDNSNGSQGTFYEGAMTAAGTFPTKETNEKIHNNVIAAHYNEQLLSIAPANAVNTPPGLQTFSLQSSQNTTVTFTNTMGTALKDVILSLSLPKSWKSTLLNAREVSKKFAGSIAPGASVSATFRVTSGQQAFNGDLVGNVSWTNPMNGKKRSEKIVEKVRNVSPVKINEFRITDGSPENSTNAFIELYNPGENEVDISNWSFTQHSTQLPIFSSVKVPAGKKIAPHGFYLLGLANSGLTVPAKKGESTIFVRTASGMSVGDIVKVGTGAARESRKIASINTPAGPEPVISPFDRGRLAVPGNPTTIWQPLPEGPVITIPAGSKNIPVASVDGFEVGQKIAIGYGTSYPAVAQAIEKYEVVTTITNVGKPGTQAWLSVDAKAGSTNIKVSSVANVSVGDKIRLDIDSKGHGIETVTVTKVGTQSVRGPGRGPLGPSEDPGTGLELAAPLKFDHSANISFSVRGTGISFEPATAFAHSSNEPVLQLTSSITLDKALSNNHDIDAVVYDEKVTSAGYQGTKQPDQWFGGPVLASSAGNMVLRDANGNIVDGLNYGGLVDPWLAEGYQGTSGSGKGGSFAPSPGISRRFFAPSSNLSVNQANRSAGRFPDGYDSDNNGSDFVLQNTNTLAAPSMTGSNNIKVNSVADFTIGQKIFIGSGSNIETAVVAVIGTAGGTTLGTATTAGTTEMPVASVTGFEAGQNISIGSGTNAETAVIASVKAARRRFGGNAANRPKDSITVTAPLQYAHVLDAQVSGSGVTLAIPLKRTYESGTQVADDLPTPGEPNKYLRGK